MLNPSAEYVLREFYARWARADTDGAMAYCADDVVFAMYLPRDVVPFGGEAQGKVAMRTVLDAILRDFAHVYFIPVGITMIGQLARAQVRFCFRHRASALELDGVMRHEVVIEAGQINMVREYHDTERIRAFMMLAASSQMPAVSAGRSRKDLSEIVKSNANAHLIR
jgi:uncharacterized protein